MVYQDILCTIIITNGFIHFHQLKTRTVQCDTQGTMKYNLQIVRCRNNRIGSINLNIFIDLLVLLVLRPGATSSMLTLRLHFVWRFLDIVILFYVFVLHRVFIKAGQNRVFQWFESSIRRQVESSIRVSSIYQYDIITAWKMLKF